MFKTIINTRVVSEKPLSLEDVQSIEDQLNALFISTKSKIIMFKKMNIEEAAEEAILQDLEPEYLNIKIDHNGNVFDLGYSNIH